MQYLYHMSLPVMTGPMAFQHPLVEKRLTLASSLDGWRMIFLVHRQRPSIVTLESVVPFIRVVGVKLYSKFFREISTSSYA